MRSSIPRVVGVLAIVFSMIGLCAAWLFGLRQARQLADYNEPEQLDAVIRYLEIWFAISLLLFALQFVGGILACTYRKVGLSLITSYAIGALFLVVIDLVLLWNAPQIPHDRHGGTVLVRLLLDVLAAPWPLTAVVLVNVGRARASCR